MDALADANVIYEYTFARRRIAEPFGSIRVPQDVADVFSRICVTEGYSTDEQENFLVLAFSTKNDVIGYRRLYVGNLAGASVRVGEVYKMPIVLGAAAIAVAHNHPSGDTAPSSDDINLTTELRQAGKLLDIELLDHVIVGERGHTSLRAIGVIG